MEWSYNQLQFVHTLGTTILADLGFAPDSPELPGILREAADKMLIYRDQGKAAWSANLDALASQDAQRAYNIVMVSKGAALSGISSGLKDIEEVTSTLKALAAQLEADFQPA